MRILALRVSYQRVKYCTHILIIRQTKTNMIRLTSRIISLSIKTYTKSSRHTQASASDLLWAWRVARHWPVLGHQSLSGCWLSLLPETTRLLVGCQSTHLTSAPCPRRTFSSKHRLKSQIRTVPSSEQVVNFASVGHQLFSNYICAQLLRIWSSSLHN